MEVYSIIITIIALAEAVAIYFIFMKGERKEIKALKHQRESALKIIDDNIKEMRKLEQANEDIKNEAQKINNADDAFNFLRSIAKSDKPGP